MAGRAVSDSFYKLKLLLPFEFSSFANICLASSRENCLCKTSTEFIIKMLVFLLRFRLRFIRCEQRLHVETTKAAMYDPFVYAFGLSKEVKLWFVAFALRAEK